MKLFRPNFPFRPDKIPFFYGWVMVVASALGMVASIPGQTMGVSVFTEIYMDVLGINRNTISQAYLVGTLMSACCLPSVGKIFDRFGSRPTMVVTCVSLGLSLVYFSQIDHISEFLVQFQPAWSTAISMGCILFGFFLIRLFGQGTLMMTSNALIGKWFFRNRGKVQIYKSVIVSFSFSLAPLALNNLINLYTWSGALLLLAILLIFLFGGINWLLVRDNPEECGLMMDGETKENPLPKNENPDLVFHKEFTRNEAIKTIPYWAFSLSLCLQGLLITAYTFHIISMAKDSSMDENAMLQLFFPASFVSLTATLILGRFTEKIRLKYYLLFHLFSLSLLCLGVLLLPSPIGIGILITGIGLSGSCFGILTGLVWPRYFGRKHLGAISGIHLFFLVTASAIGPYLFSLIFEHFGSYRNAFLLCMTLSLFLALLAIKADNPQRKLVS